MFFLVYLLGVAFLKLDKPDKPKSLSIALEFGETTTPFFEDPGDRCLELEMCARE